MIWLHVAYALQSSCVGVIKYFLFVFINGINFVSTLWKVSTLTYYPYRFFLLGVAAHAEGDITGGVQCRPVPWFPGI